MPADTAAPAAHLRHASPVGHLPGTRITPRRRVIGALDEMLATARAGGCAALVLRGEAGIGKTALLDHLIGQATGCVTLRASGVDTETGMPYAGLHQLLLPVADRIGQLPLAARDALAAVLGLECGPVPDPLVVGRAASTLLDSCDRPLVCAVDDAHLLDPPSLAALGVVARAARVGRGVALVLAARDGSAGSVLAAAPEVRIAPLSDDEARALLAEVLAAPVDGLVRDRIVAEAHGNPRLLLDLPGALTAADAAAGFTTAPRRADVAAEITQQLDALPGAARRALVLAAAEPVGDAGVFWRAVERLGIDREAVDLMERAGLVDVGPRVRFRHPALRSAAYHTASVCERKAAHAALALATDARADPDWRAWHRALAAYGPDEEIAAELEAASPRAMDRGGQGAAAALLDSAAMLTPDPERRAARLLAAASAQHAAGAIGAALRLVAIAETFTGDHQRSAEILHVRGRIARDRQRPLDAVRLLSDAAARFEHIDGLRSKEAHLEALVASLGAGTPHATAAAALRSLAGHTDRPVDHLLEALAFRVVAGPSDAAARLRRSLAHAVRAPLTDVEAEAACAVAVEVWDADALQQLALSRAQRARSVGAAGHLQRSLDAAAFLRLLGGGAHESERLGPDAHPCRSVAGLDQVAPLAVLAAAFRGDEAATAASVQRLLAHAPSHEPHHLRMVARYAQAVVANGLGRYESARDATRDLLDAATIGWWPFLAPEIAEAASRAGDEALLRQVLGRVTVAASATPTDWSRGIADRIRALTCGGDVTDRLHRRSIERLERTPLRVEVARGRLLYGEWLRREGRRADARAQLGAAHDLLDDLGFEGFARRARRELRATGETVRARQPGSQFDLTPQEAEIARLAAGGSTNVEIALQLFISPRTVEWHLRKIFAKLGITARRQLRRHDGVCRALRSLN